MKAKTIITALGLVTVIIAATIYVKTRKPKDPRTLRVGQKVSYYGDTYTIVTINYETDTYELLSDTAGIGVPYSNQLIPV